MTGCGDNEPVHACYRSALFAAFESRERAYLRRNGTDGSSWHDRPITTLVCRVPDTIAQQLHVVTRSLVADLPQEYVYPPGDLHLTVINLDHAVRSSLDLHVKEVVGQEPTWTVQLFGLGLSRHTLFAKAFANPPTSLMRLRRRLRYRLRTGPAWPQPSDAVAYVNLIRFNTNTAAPLGDHLHPFRRQSFGAFTADTLELVETDKVLSAERTRTLDTFHLLA